MSSPHEDFTELWRAEAPRVMAFATRHVGPDAARDVVAETFTIAWRRWNDLPTPAIGWLLVTARKVIQNRARSNRRSQALDHRIALLDGIASYVGDTAEAVINRREALERLARLDDQHREALLLVSWDGLTTEQAADALGIKPATLRRRVSRARAALFAPSTAEPPGPEHHLIPVQELS